VQSAPRFWLPVLVRYLYTFTLALRVYLQIRRWYCQVPVTGTSTGTCTRPVKIASRTSTSSTGIIKATIDHTVPVADSGKLSTIYNRLTVGSLKGWSCYVMPLRIYGTLYRYSTSTGTVSLHERVFI
jgi:hypothetical protein